MTLYELKIGKSKKKMHTQMIAPGSTINTYLQSRNANAKQINALGGLSGKFGDGNWYEVTLAPKGSKEYQRKSATVGGNKCHSVPRINKQGKTSIPGYISKSGFQPHT